MWKGVVDVKMIESGINRTRSLWSCADDGSDGDGNASVFSK